MPSPRNPSGESQLAIVPTQRVPSPGSQLASMPSPSINLASKPAMSPSPSNGVYGLKKTAPYPQTPTALIPGYPSQTPGGVTPPSSYQTPLTGSSPLAPTASNTTDYFGNRRPSQASSIASSAASMAAGKKKPPPPIPAKRLPSFQAQFVTALYDFEGQNAGDLAFREGDKIRVVKKTDSTDDWWDGELKGRTGAFPANYVQV